MYQNPGMRGVCYILLNPMILLRGRWMRKEKGRGFFCLFFLQAVKPIMKDSGFRVQGSGFSKCIRMGDRVFAIPADR